MQMWEFKTKNIAIYASADPAYDLDLSWDDDGSIAKGLRSGLYQAFDVTVTAYSHGIELASNCLGQCIYERIEEFFEGHRTSNPMDRNCQAMRAVRGDNVVICHYFPGMVREVCKAARKQLAALQAVPIRDTSKPREPLYEAVSMGKHKRGLTKFAVRPQGCLGTHGSSNGRFYHVVFVWAETAEEACKRGNECWEN